MLSEAVTGDLLSEPRNRCHASVLREYRRLRPPAGQADLKLAADLARLALRPSGPSSQCMLITRVDGRDRKPSRRSGNTSHSTPSSRPRAASAYRSAHGDFDWG
jgi:hypothetical protein